MMAATAGRKPTGDQEQLYVYEVGAIISHNAHSVLKTCTNQCTGKEYCVNIVEKGSVRNLMETRRGLKIWKSCDHPNILKLQNNFETPDSLFQVVNTHAGSSLLTAVDNKKINGEKECATIVRDICGALCYLHSRDIVHCAVSPRNIAFDPDGDRVPYLTNFEDATSCHLNRYIASETASNMLLAPDNSERSEFTSEVDMWGLGITAYTLLMGFEPCHPDKFQHESWDHSSQHAKDLVDKMVNENYSERVSVTDVLCHPWIVTEGDPESFDTNVLNEMCAKRRDELMLVAKEAKSSRLTT